jgi:cbb3-type cytochrome oxidase subunit 3
MPDAYFWIAFFGAPMLLLLTTVFVFRPSAREQYREAKRVIFADEDVSRPRRESRGYSGRR